jgi:glucokinase
VSASRRESVVLALDVGGTTIKGGAVDAAGGLWGRRRWSTRRLEGLDAVLGAIRTAADELAADHPEAVALGLAVPGAVDVLGGVARRSTTLAWRDVPFGDEYAARLGVPVAMINDVRAGGLAEHRLGAGRESADMLFVALGTGIATAILSGGRLVDGAHAVAGELGHLVVEVGGPPCLCGNRGCLETVASGWALAETDPGGAEAVVRRAEAGDPGARAAWDAAVEGLTTGLAACTMLLDPAVIVLGGGIARAGQALLEPVRRRLAARLVVDHAPPDVRLAELGDVAGCVGAGLLAWDAVREGASA